MNVSEFKAWLLRNVGKGGSRPKTDPFNRQLKGSERNPSASEYASKDIPEYNHYAENQDLRKKDDDQQDESSQQQQQQQQQGSQNAMSSQAGGQVAKSVARNLVSKVVLVGVGSVTVVTSYNVIKEKEAVASTVASVSWTWNEDHSDATLALLNKEGILIRHVASTITSADTPATCDKNGERIYTATATDQGQTYTDQQSVVLAALGHALNDGEETIIDGDPAMRYECTRCHKDFVVTIPPGGLDPSKPKLLSRWSWNEDHTDCHVEFIDMDGHYVKTDEVPITVTTVEPTCVEDGLRTYTATIHEGDYDYTNIHREVIPASGVHTYGPWTTVTPATCVKDGEEEHVCSECDHKETRPIPATGVHTYGEWQTVTPATCVKDGEEEHVCSECDHKETRPIPATGVHTYGEWQTVTPATCVKDGEEEHVCSECGHKESRTIPATGVHTYGEWQIVTPATCTEDGLEKHVCSECGHEETQVIHSPGHIWEEDWTIDVQPTCTKDGSKSHHCENCDEVKDVTVVGALGHDFDEGTKKLIDGKPAIVYTCSRCEETFTIIIDEKEVPTPRYEAQWTWNKDYSACTVKLIDPDDGHTVKEDSAEVKPVSTVDPTCTLDGAKTFKATYVDGWDTYSDTGIQVLPALGHDFDEGTPTIIDGDPAIKYECSRCDEEFTIKTKIEEE